MVNHMDMDTITNFEVISMSVRHRASGEKWMPSFSCHIDTGLKHHYGVLIDYLCNEWRCTLIDRAASFTGVPSWRFSGLSLYEIMMRVCACINVDSCEMTRDENTVSFEVVQSKINMTASLACNSKTKKCILIRNGQVESID